MSHSVYLMNDGRHVTHSCVTHMNEWVTCLPYESFTWETCDVHMGDMWLIHVSHGRHVTHSCVTWHMSPICDTCLPYVMAHMNEPCHACMSHVTYEWVIAHPHTRTETEIESWSLRRAFSWLVDMWDMTPSYGHSYEKHESFAWKTWLIDSSLIWETWLVDMRDMTQSCLRKGIMVLGMCVFVTRWYVRHDSLIWETWLVDMRDMTQSCLKKCIMVLEMCVFVTRWYVRHDSFMHDHSMNESCLSCKWVMFLIWVIWTHSFNDHSVPRWYRVAKTHRIP